MRRRAVEVESTAYAGKVSGHEREPWTMRCGDVREFMFAFLDNELDVRRSMALQRHLDRCPYCARQVEIERIIIGHLKRALVSDDVAPTFSERSLATSHFAKESRLFGETKRAHTGYEEGTV